MFRRRCAARRSSTPSSRPVERGRIWSPPGRRVRRRASTCAGVVSAARRRSTRSSRCRASLTTTTTGSGSMAARDGRGATSARGSHRTRLVLNRASVDEWGESQPGAGRSGRRGCRRRAVDPRPDRRARVGQRCVPRAGSWSRRICRSWATRWSTASLFEGRRAVGVRTVGGDEIEADLVVVSAGAIHSPAILLRSGVDTPGVGANLHDHPSFPIAIQLHEPAPPGRLAHRHAGPAVVASGGTTICSCCRSTASIERCPTSAC